MYRYDLGVLNISHPEDLHKEERVPVEIYLYDLEELMGGKTLGQFADALREIDFLLEDQYSRLDIGKFEIDYAESTLVVIGHRLETEEEKEKRLSNLRLREDYRQMVENLVYPEPPPPRYGNVPSDSYKQAMQEYSRKRNLLKKVCGFYGCSVYEIDSLLEEEMNVLA